MDVSKLWADLLTAFIAPVFCFSFADKKSVNVWYKYHSQKNVSELIAARHL